jgi:hypothetical protein
VTAHPSEDALIEHFCGETAGDERARLESHLAACPECRRTFDDLTAALTMVHDAVPEPRDGFEHLMWTRIKFAIADAAPTVWTWRQLVPAGALVAAVVIGVSLAGAGGDRARPDTPAATTAETGEATLNERVLYTALDAHLQQAEALLIEVRNAPDRDSLDVERLLADDLIASGRLYRLTAEMTGYQGAVQVLDDIEPVLVEVARGPRRIDAHDRAWLRTRIEDDDLLFKIRAVTTDVRDRAGSGH